MVTAVSGTPKRTIQEALTVDAVCAQPILSPEKSVIQIQVALTVDAGCAQPTFSSNQVKFLGLNGSLRAVFCEL